MVRYHKDEKAEDEMLKKKWPMRQDRHRLVIPYAILSYSTLDPLPGIQTFHSLDFKNIFPRSNIDMYLSFDTLDVVNPIRSFCLI